MHPELEPFESGSLERPDGNLIHWETSGNPTGRPALSLHGGPTEMLIAQRAIDSFAAR